MSDKPFILIADGFDKDLFQQLQTQSEFDVHPEAKNSQDTIKELLPKTHGIVIRSATKMNREYIDMAPNLKYIIRAGEGTDNIDKAYCEEKGIKVSNTPGANNNSAAEHALALMLTVLRKTAWAHQKMQNGGWDKSLFTGNELTNKKVGIVGFGRIGQLLAKRLRGFEPDIIFFDPSRDSSPIPEAKQVSSMEEVFTQADIVSLHVPLTDSTKLCVNKEMLSKMQPHAILVNAARGKVVDEEALYQALSNNTIRGAGFDVFATEPLPEDSPLRKLSNIVLTPHLGGSTEEAQFRVGEMALHQLKEFFLNDNLLNEVKA